LGEVDLVDKVVGVEVSLGVFVGVGAKEFEVGFSDLELKQRKDLFELIEFDETGGFAEDLENAEKTLVL